MTMQFELDPKLQNDSYILGEFENSMLLLMKNAHYPWFILVPKTQEIEFYKLTQDQQLAVMAQINRLSDYIHSSFAVDKLNIATIGNVVSQLHIHIIGRNRNDPCWPNVVWGSTHFKSYNPSEVSLIAKQVQQAFNDTFKAWPNA